MPDDPRQRETEAYLARIRRTIAESDRLVEAARLRMAETDRMLESQGLTREQVLNLRFSEEQREAVNRELVRHGLDPLEDDAFAPPADAPSAPAPGEPPFASSSGDLENRRQKFGMMMKPFQI